MANTKRSTGAKRKPQPKQQAAGGSRVGWFLSGLLPGLFVAYLVHMHHDRDASVMTPSSPGETAGQQEERGGDSNRPRFEFYELLSEMEVVVPDEPDDADADDVAEALPDTPATPSPDATPSDPEPAEEPATGDAEERAHYMVQAGSFQSHEDADRMKANLALIGVEANIESVEVDSGETWHRVRIGPFADRDRVDSLRSQLEDNNVDSILLRSRS
ncbi:SPOR domain-containing protein [Aquisalimonas asiatica]|uniref:Sporulation related domain-containing protein n=1 Tax=Aquisalimonas asiatica TaxID=406100 RepID=A0A1H8TCC7_9GAMM|nr:SPOR domain-containing protein [Aquisalimonas asiatica]SEO88740.1 Sporulation related domain-containing protein [Aquisalimonas asiatica]